MVDFHAGFVRHGPLATLLRAWVPGIAAADHPGLRAPVLPWLTMSGVSLLSLQPGEHAITAHASAPSVFALERCPWTLRTYDFLTDDRDKRAYESTGRPRFLVAYLSKRLVRRFVVPWLLRVGPRFGTFRYRGVDERLVSFPVRNVQFESVFARRYRDCYEPRVATLLTRFLPRNGVLFDIGSNWGHFSLHVAAVAGNSVEIHAFEPQPSVADDLQAIVAQAGLTDVVTLHRLALSDRRGEVRLSVPRGFESGLARIVTEGKTVSVPSERLDDLDLPAPHVMKVDVEGHEAEVFSGAARILREAEPVVVFESTYDATGGDALRALHMLESLGYRAFEPVWKLATGSGHVLSRDDTAALGSEGAELVLLPVSVESRPLLPKYLNLLGCHSSRIEELGIVVV